MFFARNVLQRRIEKKRWWGENDADRWRLTNSWWIPWVVMGKEVKRCGIKKTVQTESIITGMRNERKVHS